MMTPEEIFQRLKPILGKKIERLWKVYLIEDNNGKREIEQMMQILYNQTFPESYNEELKSTLFPPPSEKARGEYPIGNITYTKRELYPFGLREQDWIKHMLIVGASGSGKTNLCFQILKNFFYKDKPFLVFDWKRNYRDIIKQDEAKNVKVYTVGREIAPLKFNPLIPPPGTSAKTWLKKLIEIIAHATFCGDGVMYLLQQGLDQTYKQYGLYDEGPIEKYPTLTNLLEVMEKMEVKGRAGGWKSSTMRALGALTFGESGKIYETQNYSHMIEILKNPVILELDALTNTDKTFLVESILLWIHHYRLSSPSGRREQFDHAIILEEAHHIIGKAKSDLIGGEAITDVIIREIRELGESVIIIDQCPSLLSLPARGNTWSTMVLNLKDAKDVNSAASALLLESADKKILGRLDVGQAVVKLQGRWQRPFTINIPKVSIKKGSVSDEKLLEYMAPYSTYSEGENLSTHDIQDIPEKNDQRKIEKTLKTEELELLQDIKNHPYSGVVERYQRLHYSMRKGNKYKQTLTDKGLVGPAEITTNNGRLIVLSLTKVGKNYFQEPSHELISTQIRQGGPIHEYWKNKYAEIYKKDGFAITLEEPVGNGKTVDLVARNHNKCIAIEIETGRSDILANIYKCLQANFDNLVIIATSKKTFEKIKTLLINNKLIQNHKIKLQLAQDLVAKN